MKVVCTIANAVCPEGLDICCGICNHKDTCEICCPDVQGYAECADAKTITDDVVPFESAGAVAIQKIGTLMRLKKELEDQERQLKQDLAKAMEAYGIKSFENDLIKMTYVAPTTRTTIDSTKLKKDHPDIVQQYSKTSNVSASVRVTVK